MKHFIERFVLYSIWGLCLLLCYLPEKISYLICRGLLEIVLLVSPHFRKVGMRNLELAFPEKSVSERQRILADSFRVLARHMVFFTKLRFFNREWVEKHVDYEIPKGLCAALQTENNPAGSIYVTMHFGPFELLQHCHAICIGSTHVLARGTGMPLVDAWWARWRGVAGNRTFARRGGYKEMFKQLSEGNNVALLADQNVKANHATFVDFLGIPAATTKSYALATLRTGSPIFAGYLWEDSPNKFKAYFERIDTQCEGTPDERVKTICTRVNTLLEKGIREHPEQWFWIHRRFKTRPPGEDESLYN